MTALVEPPERLFSNHEAASTTVEERPFRAAFTTQYVEGLQALLLSAPITLVCGRGIFRLATSSPGFLVIRGWLLVHWFALRPVYQRNS